MAAVSVSDTNVGEEEDRGCRYAGFEIEMCGSGYGIRLWWVCERSQAGERCGAGGFTTLFLMTCERSTRSTSDDAIIVEDGVRCDRETDAIHADSW